MERAADPRRPFLLSSVTAKMHTTSCMVRKTSTVVAIPRLMPGCSWKSRGGGKNQTVPRANPELMLASDQSTKQLPLWVFTVFIDRFPLMLPGVTPYSTAAPATAPRHWAAM